MAFGWRNRVGLRSKTILGLDAVIRLKLKRFWRFCPRPLTLALLAVIAALIVLANLTDEMSRRGDEVLAGPGQVRFSLRDPGPVPFPKYPFHWPLWSLSYGWPLLWRQYIVGFSTDFGAVLGECYSPSRLASNLAIWLVMLAAPGACCEWLLRRRRRRFQWSLRTMLAGVGLAAALCGWFVALRNTADLQDAVMVGAKRTEIGMGRVGGNAFWLKRRGPSWLSLVGADRYRRTIVGAKVSLAVHITDELEVEGRAAQLLRARVDENDFKEKQELLTRLPGLRQLEYLFIDTNEATPDLVDALRRMPQLRALSIQYDRDGYFSPDDKPLSRDCLAAIGAMSRLERLSLQGMPLASESLECLGGLTNLRSLRLQVNRDADEEAPASHLLARLPALPRLEAVDLESCYVGDRGLRYLSVLPRLKTLNLSFTEVTDCDLEDLPGLDFDSGLADLARLECLEEVTVDGDMASATGLESLLALKHLKRLHIGGPYIGKHATSVLMLDHGHEVRVRQAEIGRCRRALDALWQANPGIVIDGNSDATDWPEERLVVPTELEGMPLRPYALDLLRDWKKGIR